MKSMFKQMASPEQMASLSPTAKKKLAEWCREKDYGSTFDGEFIPTVQLSIGQMIEFLKDHKSLLEERGNFTIQWIKEKDLCDVLFSDVQDILEQKN